MPDQTWDDYPAALHPPTSSGREIKLSENGWGALLAWTAGPDHVVHRPAEDRPAVITSTVTDGQYAHSEHQRTASEQAEIDGDINDYLAEAEVPPRPAGFDWWLMLPSRCADEAEFVKATTGAVSHSSPLADREVLESVMQNLYG